MIEKSPDGLRAVFFRPLSDDRAMIPVKAFENERGVGLNTLIDICPVTHLMVAENPKAASGGNVGACYVLCRDGAVRGYTQPDKFVPSTPGINPVFLGILFPGESPGPFARKARAMGKAQAVAFQARKAKEAEVQKKIANEAITEIAEGNGSKLANADEEI